METKQTRPQLELIKRKIGYQNFFVVDSIGKSGDLALFQSEDSLLKIMNYSQYHVHCEIKENKQENSFLFTGFYGKSRVSERKDSWDLLAKVNQGITLPWCVIGDFNQIVT